VGPPIVHKLQAGGPARNLQATSCQEIYFYFYLEHGIKWDITAGITRLLVSGVKLKPA